MEIYGLKSFDEYCYTAVVKGKFHLCIPKDITGAFIIAECTVNATINSTL